MKTNDIVKLKKEALLSRHYGENFRRATEYAQKKMTTNDGFTVVSVSGANAVISDSNGDLWSCLVELLEIVLDVTTVNANTTVGESVGIGKRILTWFKKVFKRK